MYDERGQTVAAAGPSTPVQVLGFEGVPKRRHLPGDDGRRGGARHRAEEPPSASSARRSIAAPVA